jgi:hypothetical protein
LPNAAAAPRTACAGRRPDTFPGGKTRPWASVAVRRSTYLTVHLVSGRAERSICRASSPTRAAPET